MLPPTTAEDGDDRGDGELGGADERCDPGAEGEARASGKPTNKRKTKCGENESGGGAGEVREERAGNAIGTY